MASGRETFVGDGVLKSEASAANRGAKRSVKYEVLPEDCRLANFPANDEFSIVNPGFD
ncbi:hypothetical protein GCM10009771_06800 [Nesterenkonia flava]